MEEMKKFDLIFNRHSLSAITNDEPDKVYLKISDILSGIGFLSSKVSYYMKKIGDDRFISKGILEVDGSQYIASDKIPTMFGKISITSKTRSNNPEIAAAFDAYQEDLVPFIEEHFPDIFCHNVTTSPAATPDVPLTREELAAFMIYTTDMLETQRKFNEDFLKSIKENNENVIKEQISRITETINAVVPKQNIHVVETDVRKNELRDKVLCIADKCNLNFSQTLKTMYAIINYDKETDFAALCNEVRKENNIPNNTSLFDVISASKELSDEFDKYLDYEINHDAEDVIAINECKNSAVLPESIVNIVSRLYDQGIYNKKSAVHYVYRRMEQMAGISLDSIVKRFSDDHFNKRVCKGYVISKDPQLMDLFVRAVDSLLDENGGV